MAKKLIVGNPRDIPEGIPIMQRDIDGEAFYMGDVWFPADGWSKDKVKNIQSAHIATGMLVEVEDG